MPVYEYICLQCSEKFSALQNIHATANDTKCPQCSSNRVKKVLSAFSCSSSSENDFSPPMPPPVPGKRGGG